MIIDKRNVGSLATSPVKNNCILNKIRFMITYVPETIKIVLSSFNSRLPC